MRWFVGSAAIVLVSLVSCAELASVRDDLVFDPNAPGADGATTAQDGAGSSDGTASGETSADAPSSNDATTCREQETLCADDCKNLQTDRDNCGMCGKTCQLGQFCDLGTCATSCSGTLCGTSCVNTQTDEQHCGTCFKSCPPTQECVGGGCRSTTIVDGGPPG